MTQPTTIVPSRVLRVLSDALARDTLVTPVVIAATPGIGAFTTLRAVAGAIGEVADLRCATMSPFDFRPISFLRDGEVVEATPSIEYLRQKLETRLTTVVILDEAVANGTEVAAHLMRQVVREAVAPTVVALVVQPGDLDDAYRAIAEGTGVVEDQVPTGMITGPGRADDAETGQSDVPTPEELASDFLAWGRANGLDGRIADLLEAHGGLAQGTPEAWMQASATLQSDWFGQLDARTADAMLEGVLGEEAFDVWQRRDEIAAAKA